MKKIVIVLLISITFLQTSCKKGGETTEVKTPTKQNFSVEILAQSSKKDDFAVYYTEDGTINFDSNKVLWHGVKPGVNEKIVFDFPEEKLPTAIRLDFGMNKEQDSVVISKVKIAYLDENFEFNGSDFFNFFIQDKQFKVNTNTKNGTLTLYKNGATYSTPYFYPRGELAEKIKAMTKD